MSGAIHRLIEEVEAGRWKPMYLVIGDEPLQAGWMLDALKRAFFKDKTDQLVWFITQYDLPQVFDSKWYK